MVFVDELFVAPAARGRGVGTAFLAAVARDRPFGAVAVALDVSPANGRARRLYDRLGFRPAANATLVRPLPPPG